MSEESVQFVVKARQPVEPGAWLYCQLCGKLVWHKLVINPKTPLHQHYYCTGDDCFAVQSFKVK